MNAAKRGELLKDLVDDVDFANSLKAVTPLSKQEGMVRAWEAISGSSFSTDITTLTRLSDQIDIHAAKLDDFKARFAGATDTEKQMLIDELERFFGFKPGFFKETIVATPKGSRPAPNTYLTSNYLNQHQAIFNGEGGAFLVVKPWIEGSSYPTFPPKKYAMSRSDMQSVMDEYATTGDLRVIERGLGYSPGDLAGLEDELYVFFPSSSSYSFKMPDGNEIGANSLWEPGGFTSGGKREAVIEGLTDPNEVIVHNNDINELISQFDYEKL